MLLQVEHISKAFNGHQVLSDVCFDVQGGEAAGLLGANGAGKTTLLRIITRLMEADSGQVLLDGHPLMQDDLRRIGYLPEERGLYRSHKAAEEALHDWFHRLGMDDWWGRPAGKLSKGMQQKLQFVVTVAHRPDLVILDEPFSGFDAENSAMLKQEIMNLKASGTAILFSTHNLPAAGELCNKTIQL